MSDKKITIRSKEYKTTCLDGFEVKISSLEPVTITFPESRYDEATLRNLEWEDLIKASKECNKEIEKRIEEFKKAAV